MQQKLLEKTIQEHTVLRHFLTVYFFISIEKKKRNGFEKNAH